jgi:hypothetical protein
MQFSLSSLDSSKSKEFIAYFAAAIKEKNKLPFLGAAYAFFNAERQYETTIHDSIKSQAGTEYQVEWKIIQNPNGTIAKFEALTPIGTEPDQYKNEINQFVLKVMSNALSNTKKTFYHRSHYCYLGGVNLIGEYWLDSKTRIAPLYENDDSFQPISEKVIVIDQKVDAIDSFHANQIGEENAIEYSAYISFLLDLGLYLPKREERWILFRDPITNNLVNKRYLTGISNEGQPVDMPKRGELLKVAQPFSSLFINYERSFYDGITFPKESKALIKALKLKGSINQQAFYRCCKLYQLAMCLGIDYPTVKISYLVGAIDAICQTTQIANGFSAFILKYIPKADKEFLDILHSKIRSAHWHSGNFFLGEDESKTKEFILDAVYHQRHNIMINSHTLIRSALVNWIFAEILNNYST